MVKFKKETIFNGIKEYCGVYNIPIDNLIDILQDQKVLPMIRGKATEYIAAVVIDKVLGHNWHVQKLNLNAQQSGHDEDISVTHAKTGDRLKVEVKSAVRSSFKMGNKRTIIKTPHFRVKCHKSRSNIKKSSTTNDRYLVGDFDLIVCNISNAVFKAKTLSDKLELIDDKPAINYLKNYYKVSDEDRLVRCVYDDWRGCFPRLIADSDRSIPRTPSVTLEGDDNWFKISELEDKLLNELEHIK